MAISPNRIPVQTMEKALQQVARAATECIAMIDNVVDNHPDQYQTDPEKVKISRTLSSVEKITVGNTDYLKELLVKQISDEYVKAGWKDAYVSVEYRDEVFSSIQANPQTCSVDKIVIDLYFKTIEEEVTTNSTQSKHREPAGTPIDNKLELNSVGLFRHYHDGNGGTYKKLLSPDEIVSLLKRG